MKKYVLFFLLLSFSTANTQSLPMDFESAITTANFIDFNGGTAMVIDNPQPNGLNTSSKVAQIVRDGGAIWAGSKIELTANLDFSSLNSISMKVFTTAPIGTTVKFKLEGAGETERDVQTTVSNEWEVLTWDFTGAPSNFNTVVFMFDFGNVGNGSAASTFLFDDVEQLFGGFQIDFPVDFESVDVNYTTTDFGGNVSNLESDPVTPGNKVIRVIKTAQAATWAGTTIGTPAGFATSLPLTLTSSKMTVRVWSPDPGIPIRLKVEDSNDPTHTCETETNTTKYGEWETLEFDFANQAPGTESLSVGLSMGWTYNMASIFFNFDTDGATAGEKTYFFDDVAFGALTNSKDAISVQNLSIFPNPTSDIWTISSEKNTIKTVDIYDVEGKLLSSVFVNQYSYPIDASALKSGIYMAKVSDEDGVQMVKLLKK